MKVLWITNKNGHLESGDYITTSKNWLWKKQKDIWQTIQYKNYNGL